MWWIVVDYSNSITWTHFKTIEHTRVLWCVTALSNEELSLEASVLLNEAKKVIYHFIHLSDEGSPNNKKRDCENEYKSHLISLIFLLITANFPLGPWERASLRRSHLICRLHISACRVAPSVPSPRPSLAGACGEAGLLGPPLFWPGRKVRRKPRAQSPEREWEY